MIATAINEISAEHPVETVQAAQADLVRYAGELAPAHRRAGPARVGLPDRAVRGPGRPGRFGPDRGGRPPFRAAPRGPRRPHPSPGPSGRDRQGRRPRSVADRHSSDGPAPGVGRGAEAEVRPGQPSSARRSAGRVQASDIDQAPDQAAATSAVARTAATEGDEVQAPEPADRPGLWGRLRRGGRAGPSAATDPSPAADPAPKRSRRSAKTGASDTVPPTADPSTAGRPGAGASGAGTPGTRTSGTRTPGTGASGAGSPGTGASGAGSPGAGASHRTCFNRTCVRFRRSDRRPFGRR